MASKKPSGAAGRWCTSSAKESKNSSTAKTTGGDGISGTTFARSLSSTRFVGTPGGARCRKASQTHNKWGRLGSAHNDK